MNTIKCSLVITVVVLLSGSSFIFAANNDQTEGLYNQACASYSEKDSNENYNKAIEMFREIVTSYPESDWADDSLWEIGYIRSYLLKEGVKGIETWEELINKYPQSEKAAFTQHGVGFVYHSLLRNEDKAISSWEKTVKNYPDSEWGILDLLIIGDTLLESAKKELQANKDAEVSAKFERAISYSEKYIAKSQKRDHLAHAQHSIGRCYHIQRMYDEALLAYGKTVHNYPSEKGALESLREIGKIQFYELKNYAEAKSAFRKIIDTYPDSDLAREAQSWIEKMQGILDNKLE